MELAQAKAINSFSFRDIMNTLTELWAYCYERISQVDSGFYSVVMPIDQRLTRLPSMLKQSILVFASRDLSSPRKVYKEAGYNDMNSPWTYRISGNDLFCWDAPTRRVWLEYVPEPPFLTFTKNNRDYKIFSTVPAKQDDIFRYGMFELVQEGETPAAELNEYIFRTRGSTEEVNLTNSIKREGYEIRSFILDHPYLFISYEHVLNGDTPTGDFESYIIEDLLGAFTRKRYNPFDYMGRDSNLEFLSAKYNDYTGMGVVVLDHDDGVAKELGWTPDSLVTYPSNVVVNYLRANIAKRFASLNNATIMAVEESLVSSTHEISKFLKKDQSAWSKMNNVTGPTWADFL